MTYVDGINNNQSTVDTLATQRRHLLPRGLEEEQEVEEEQGGVEMATPEVATEEAIEEQEEIAAAQEKELPSVKEAGEMLLRAGAYIGDVAVAEVVGEEKEDGTSRMIPTVSADLTNPDRIVNEEFGLTARQVEKMRRAGIAIPLTDRSSTRYIVKPHAPTFTEEEDRVIHDGLRKFLPMYILAEKLQCGRDQLVRHVKETPELLQVVINRKESFKDNLEFQALRLINQGNPAMIMFGLQKQCADRGWGDDLSTLESGEGDRIVIGRIEEEEVVKAGKRIEAVKAVGDLMLERAIEESGQADAAARGEMPVEGGAVEGAIPTGHPDPLKETMAGEANLGGGYFTEGQEFPVDGQIEDDPEQAWDDGSGEDFSFRG